MDLFTCRPKTYFRLPLPLSPLGFRMGLESGLHGRGGAPAAPAHLATLDLLQHRVLPAKLLLHLLLAPLEHAVLSVLERAVAFRRSSARSGG